MPSIYEIARSRIVASVPNVSKVEYKPVRMPSGCKSKKEYDHEYYLKHRKERIAQVKEWRKSNKDKMQEYEKNYYWKHRDECLKKSTEWGKNNPEKRRESGRKCYRKHAKEYNRKQVESRRAKREATRKEAA
jgi:hypothetical protein